MNKDELLSNDIFSCGLLLFFMVTKIDYNNSYESLELIKDSNLKELLRGILTKDYKSRLSLKQIKVNSY
jgi:hypothetical protein